MPILKCLFPDVCYFRLDFDCFAIDGPVVGTTETDGGVCDEDALTITVRKLILQLSILYNTEKNISVDVRSPSSSDMWC